MQKVDLKAECRTAEGKGAARKLRAVGSIPGVLYGGDREPLPITLNRRDLALIMQSHEGHHLLVQLAVEGSTPETALAFLQALDVNPVSQMLDHADFRRVDPEKPIRTTIPIHVSGQPAGVRLGGVHQHVLREVEIEATPVNIPERLDADITHLGIGDSLHVSDLVKEGAPFAILTPGDRVISSVHMPRLATEAAPGEPGAEGAATSATTPEDKKSS